MKKEYKLFALFFVSLFMISFFSSFVSAQETGIGAKISSALDTVTEVLSPIFKYITGDSGGSSEVFLIKILFLLIILAIVWSVLELIPFFSTNTWVVALISIATSILATRILAQPGWIETVQLPYSAAGIAIISFLPLILYFYFIEKVLGQHQTLRKVAWILAAVIFVFLYFSTYSDISAKGDVKFNPAWIYMATAGICVVLFIFDKTIRRAFVDSEMKAIGAADRTALIAELRGKITHANADAVAGIITAQERDKMVKEFKKRLIAAESY